MPAASLCDLLETRRVIVTVGSGGVGKTTTAAALALAAARRGRRTLCLTIDPARRLATSLGLGEMRAEAQTIDPGLVGPGGASLTAMMLDVRRTFDELIARHAPDPAVRDRIFSNRIYRELAGSLAGTAEYMAMEKLNSLRSDSRWDLIVLDTPPTANALDFLDAPDRLVSAVDSPAVRAILQAFEGAGRMSFSLVSRAMAKVLSGFSQFTGAGFLEQIAEFLTDFHLLFGGFRERARGVREALESHTVAFVLVTSTDPMAVAEASYFSDRLRDAGMNAEALVVNRVRFSQPAPEATETTIAAVLRHAGIADPHTLARTSLLAYRELGDAARRDAEQVARIRERTRSIARVVVVPALEADVHDVAGLGRVAGYLCEAAAATAPSDYGIETAP